MVWTDLARALAAGAPAEEKTNLDKLQSYLAAYLSDLKTRCQDLE